MTKRTLTATTALAATALMLSACGPEAATGGSPSATTSATTSAQSSSQTTDKGQSSGTQTSGSASTSASGSSTNGTSSSTLNLGVVQAASDGHQIPGIGDVPQPREFDLSADSAEPEQYSNVTWTGWKSPVAYGEGQGPSGSKVLIRVEKGSCAGKPAYSALTVTDVLADGTVTEQASERNLCSLKSGGGLDVLMLPGGASMTLGTAGQEGAGYGVGAIKPSKLAINQQHGGALKDLKWAHWGSSGATGSGKVWVITGSESEGHWADAIVTLRAKKVGGRYVYSEALVYTPSVDSSNAVRYDLLDVSKAPTTQPMGN